jgi:hypothetical protein
VVDRGSNRKVSKNHIGGVKVGRVALCVVDRGSTLSVVDRRSNRRVSTNHIGGEKVSRIECDRSWVEQKSIKESHRWCKGQRDRVW